MSTYAERLAEALRASGMSKAEFARKLGLSYQAMGSMYYANAVER